MLQRPAFRFAVIGLPWLVLVAAGPKPAPVPPSDDEAAQRRTIADIRNTGNAMYSWLTDQVGAAAAGQSHARDEIEDLDLVQYSVLSHEEVQAILVPQYLHKVPEKDGWGNPYEYYMNVKKPLEKRV